jgi:hypothetical protein
MANDDPRDAPINSRVIATLWEVCSLPISA